MAVAVDPQTVAEATALIEATAQARQTLNATTTAAVTAQVRAFNGWYDHAAIGRLAKSLAALTGSGQRQTASLTSSYLTRLQRLLQGRTGRTAPRVPVADLRGVPLDSVFGRLADEYRWLHATRTAPALPETDGVHPAGKLLTDDDIDRMIEQRAAAMVGQSTSLAMVSQWAQSTERAAGPITGYRRVIHPELPTEASLRHGTEPPPVCGLCVAASTRVYHIGTLMPLHNACRCLPCAIYGEHGGPGDVGSIINEADLGRLYRDAGGSTSAAALKATKYYVVDHAELGPQLVAHKTRPAPYVQKARSEAQRASGGKGTYKAAADIQVGAPTVLRNAEAKIRELEARAANGEDVSAPLAYQRGLAERMRARL